MGLADAYRASGYRGPIEALLGVRSDGDVFGPGLTAGLDAVEWRLATDDGSAGFAGNAVQLLRARLEELAVQAAGEERVDVCVAHLASPDRAAQLTEHLAERLVDNLEGREVWCGELGAVLGAHVGPGMLAVCVAPLL